jgi:hypothetical protein
MCKESNAGGLMRLGKKQSGFGYRHVFGTDEGGMKGCIVAR